MSAVFCLPVCVVARCCVLLDVVCCLLVDVVCCRSSLLFVVCDLLFCCALFGVGLSYLSLRVVRCLLSVVCCKVFDACCLVCNVAVVVCASLVVGGCWLFVVS